MPGPMVMMTGMAEADLIPVAYRAGVSEVIMKPLSPHALLRSVATVLDHPRWTQRQLAG